jgi:glucose-1-phosphate adenylyltransferase
VKHVMGVINLSEKTGCQDLKELTRHRCIASVPFGGRYRIIDFVLSNMVNSGITNVGILTLNKYRSLLDHLGSGKVWDLHRKRDGLFILPPMQHGSPGPRGDMQYLFDHMDYLKNSAQKTVVITGGNMICNMDFREAVSFHQEMKADITVLYKDTSFDSGDFYRWKKLSLDDDGRVVAMEQEPGGLEGGRIFMEILIVGKSLLLELITSCFGQGDDRVCNLVNHGILDNLSALKIYGFPHRGYLAAIDSLACYYRHSMELLRPEVSRELFFKPGFIYTKSNDEPPAKYGEGALVQNSLVANGCHIEGEVRNSILFRGVRVHKGATISDSIILQKCTIEEGASLDTVIMDKDAWISPGRELKGSREAPLTVGKRERI